jgi:hypothetical protein
MVNLSESPVRSCQEIGQRLLPMGCGNICAPGSDREGSSMRPEIQSIVEDIQQVAGLLRRHL